MLRWVFSLKTENETVVKDSFFFSAVLCSVGDGEAAVPW